MQWFHVILTTYGAWLPGDPRGFRTRHHREHVDGDYKNPPPAGRYEGLAKHSREALVRPPATFARDLRPEIAQSLRERLENLGATLACIAVAGKHVHLLVKLPKAETRKWIGMAKQHAWQERRSRGDNRKIWAQKAKFVPVRDRAHQLNVYRYIIAHERQGAYGWKHSDNRK
jgi:hypothetical protein